MQLCRQTDLVDRYGNLLARATSSALLPSQRWPPPNDAAVRDAEPSMRALYAALASAAERAEHDVRALRVASALGVAVELLRLADCVASTHAPWKAAPESAARAQTVRALLDALRVASLLLAPAMPLASDAALTRLGVAASARTWAHARCDAANDIAADVPLAGAPLVLFGRNAKKPKTPSDQR